MLRDPERDMNRSVSSEDADHAENHRVPPTSKEQRRRKGPVAGAS